MNANKRRTPSAAKLIENWDAGASRYDAMIARVDRRFLTASREWVGARASGDVLEVAIGTGANLPFYAADVRLTGLDWSDGMLDIARDKARRLGRDVRWQQGDAAALPFDDHSFDTVVSTFAMCSVPDLEATLREALRVLRPTGHLLLADHVAAHWPLRALQHLLDLVTVPLQGEYWTRRPLADLHRMGVTIDASARTAFGAVEHLQASVR